MRKLILGTILLVALLLVSCGAPTPTISGNGQQLGPINTSPSSNSGSVPVVGNPSPNQSSTWGLALPNGIVNATGVVPNSIGTYDSTVLNTSVSDIYIVVYYDIPNSTRVGYTNLGESGRAWVTINPVSLTVPANGQATVHITLAVPDGAKLPSKNMEFWIAYKQAMGGMSQALDQRWLLTTEK